MFFLLPPAGRITYGYPIGATHHLRTRSTSVVMNATKHLRLLGNIYLAVGLPMFGLGALVFVMAANSGGEGALIALPAGALALAAFPLLLTGLGLRSGAGWGVTLSVMCSVPMLFSIVLTPLALYTFVLAYSRWSSPAERLADVHVAQDEPGPSQLADVPPALEGADDLRLPVTLWLLAAVLPLYVLAVLFSERVLELMFSVVLAPVAAYTLLTAGARWKKPFERHAGAIGLPHRTDVLEMLRRFERPRAASAQVRILTSIWAVAAIVPVYIVVAVSANGAMEMLVSLLLVPVALYTSVVAWLWLSEPYDPSTGLPDQPHRVEVAEAVRRITWPTEPRAHVRILSALWILVALLPLYIGAVLLLEGLAALPEDGLFSFDFYSGIALLLVGAAVVALAVALKRQRRPAIVIASLCSLLVAPMWPTGTVLTAYTLWTAYLVFRAQRIASQH